MWWSEADRQENNKISRHMFEHLQPILLLKQRGSLHYICIAGLGVSARLTTGPAVWCHACFSPKDPVMDTCTCWLTPIKPALPGTNDCWDVFAPLCWAGERPTIKNTLQWLWRDLLLIVPFTASPTNAMEINNAMTSSVDLGKNGNQQKPKLIIHVRSFFFVLFG